jgi:hypothetical protein
MGNAEKNDNLIVKSLPKMKYEYELPALKDGQCRKNDNLNCKGLYQK